MTEVPRILVVDDERSIRRLCREILEVQGFQVEEAENGAQALNKMASKSFHLLLSDIMMPDINGLELTSIVREKYPDTLVILITGYGSIDVAKEAIQRGAFDFVTKPFNMAELKRMIDRGLDIRRRQMADLPSHELKDLYGITVDVNISEDSIQGYLDSLASCLLKTFRSDGVRIQLQLNPMYTPCPDVTSSGEDSELPEEILDRLHGMTIKRGSGFLDSGGAESLIPEDSPVKSLMAAPIPSAESCLGSCIVTRSSIPTNFTNRDLKLMGLFAAQASNQLMNYRMASNIKQQASNLEKTNLLSAEFSSSLSTERVLASVGKGLMSMVDFDLFGVFLSGKDMVPFSYMLLRSDLPDRVLQEDFRQQLEKTMNSMDVQHFLDSGIRDSFASHSASDWNSVPSVEILDLGDIGSLKGMTVLASWHAPSPAGGSASHIPILMRHAAAALSNSYLFESSERNYIQTITALASAVDAKDRYTHNHSRNVAAYVTTIAAGMELDSREISLLNNAALLHDIGKIGVPESILNKEGSLTDEEFDRIKAHPEIGYTILRPVTAFSSFIDAVRFHHERFDGGGYPAGLAGGNIPEHARILTVADAFDAMTSDRVYRKSPGLDFAVKEVESNAGTQFDPDIAHVFLRILRDISPGKIISDYLSRGSNQLSFA